MKGKNLLFIVSWVLLLILSVGVALIALGSLVTAYGGGSDSLYPGFTLDQLRSLGSEELVSAIRGRRATAATWALSHALLSLFVIMGPYRRGERWAWWALLISLGLSQLLSLGRVLALGTTFGSGPSGTLLAFLLLGLLAGAPRIFKKDEDLRPEI